MQRWMKHWGIVAVCAIFLVVPKLTLADDTRNIRVPIKAAVSPQRTRGYFSIRYGRSFYSDDDIAPGFELDDDKGLEYAGAQIGFNWGRYLSLELALDFYEANVHAAGVGKTTEYTSYNLIPQVRLRYPMLGDRLTPYLAGGIGVSITESNDRTPLSTTKGIGLFEGRDTSLVYSLGAGVEYYIADNIAVGVEAKYLITEADVTLNGQPIGTANLNSFNTSVGLRLLFPGPPKQAGMSPPPARIWSMDSQSITPYFSFRIGLPVIADKNIAPNFNFSNHEREQVLNFILGADLNRYLGFEFSADHYDSDVTVSNAPGFTTPTKAVEYNVWNLAPQLRLRYPIMDDRLVPYVTAGVGVSFSQTNDRTLVGAFPDVPRIEAKDLDIAGSVGVGIEYYIANNMTLGLETKYQTTHPEIEIDGVEQSFGLDTFVISAGMRIYFR